MRAFSASTGTLAGIFLSLLLISGTARAVEAADSAERSDAEVSAQFHLMAGEMAAGRKEPGVAAREFLAALETVDDAALAQRATMLAIAARDEALALQGALRWLQLEPNSMDAREVIARIALAHNDLEIVNQQLDAIVQGHAGGVDDAFPIVASVLSQTAPEQADAALAAVQRLAAKYPKNAGGAHAVAIVALRFNKTELADQASRKAVELAPKSRDEKLLRVGVLVKLNRYDEAQALIENVVKKDPQADELRLAFAKLLLESRQRDAARAQLDKVLAHTPNQPDAMFALGVMAANDRDVPAAEKWLKPLLDGERSEDAAFQLGRLAEASGRYDDALLYYNRVTRGARGLDAAIRQAAVLAQTGRTDEALGELQELRDNYPQFAARFVLAEAELLMNLGRFDESLKLLNGAIIDEPDNQDLLYSRSLVFERTAKIADAEKDLRAVLATDPDDTRSLNALGYMLAVHTKRLDEAHQLVGRALELDPDDAAIIDSMGWVEFKRGNTQTASELLRRAFADFPDPEVAAHLGEVLWTLGRRDEARTVWEQALRDSPKHPVLLETVQRLSK